MHSHIYLRAHTHIWKQTLDVQKHITHTQTFNYPIHLIKSQTHPLLNPWTMRTTHSEKKTLKVMGKRWRVGAGSGTPVGPHRQVGHRHAAVHDLRQLFPRTHPAQHRHVAHVELLVLHTHGKGGGLVLVRFLPGWNWVGEPVSACLVAIWNLSRNGPFGLLCQSGLKNSLQGTDIQPHWSKCLAYLFLSEIIRSYPCLKLLGFS